MKTKRKLSCGVGVLLILLCFQSVSPLWGQMFERIDHPNENATGNTAERLDRIRYKIHFKLAPKAIDETQISPMLVWEFQERTSKNAAPSYSRARYYLTQNLAVKTAGEYNRLLDQIWNRVQADDEISLEYLTDISLKPITNNPLTDEELTPEEKLEHRRSLFVQGITRAENEYRSFSLRKHPEQLQAVKKFVEANETVFKLLEEGSRCDYCDFGIPFRETNNPIALMLPEIDNTRDLGRALRVKIMLEIHEKRYDDAIQSLRVGLGMARHIGKQPTLVCGLVGISIRASMFQELQNMLADADSPNLYWAISSLPYPFLQLFEAAEIEKQVIPQTFPILRKAMDAPTSVLDDEWRLLLRQVDDFFKQQNDNENRPLLAKLPIKSNVLLSYPVARQWLVSQGKTAAEIDAMIPEKVVGLHAAYEIRMVYGKVFRNIYLPLWEKCDANEFHNLTTAKDNPFGGMNMISQKLIGLLLPATEAEQTAYRQMQLSIDVTRIAEALRDHAARNNGNLPESLDEIKTVPIPMVNPFTGKAYEYQLENGVGKINVPELWRTVIIFETI